MASLTAKYRPRRFSEVAGQDAVKAILSRASATGKIAPAYMFSGTRGVGKTTIARIFAKALNCLKAPAPEPCNECPMCRQAQAGAAVDIIEIDAASHGGVNDVRALKEDVGYAPLEGRYKIFIIDEAHMLSTAAFNALLKTLEEPPARVTFILASTEAHKFPATILSRCQHYVFKMLPQDALAAHLEGILTAEGVTFEPGAVRIIARRGAGSVRDSISLLGQALAYSSGPLTEAEVRACLGLAGQEVFFALMEAILARDLPLLSRTLRQVLDQGLDLGFFLRELSSCWRNMFLLRQAGQAIVPELGLPAEEAAIWSEWAARFAPAHIHACWQMTLDGQQRVIKSLEPAQSLELLLLNLACLPDLLPLEALGGGTPPAAAPPSRGAPPASAAGSATGSAMKSPTNAPTLSPTVSETRQAPAQAAAQAVPPTVPPTLSPTVSSIVSPTVSPTAAPVVEPADTAASADAGPRTWEGFLAFVAGRNGSGMVTGLAQARGTYDGATLSLECHNETHCGMLAEGDNNARLQRLMAEYFGPGVALELGFAAREPQRSETEVDREMQEHPAVLRVREAFEVKGPAVVYQRGRR